VWRKLAATVSQKRDWDRLHREERVLLGGSLPYWQDGWTSQIESYVPDNINEPHLLLTSTYKGGIVIPLFSKWKGLEYRVFRQETFCIGLSGVIRGWILAPLAAKLPGSSRDPEYHAALDQALKEFNRRLEEKTLLEDIQLTDQGVVKIFHMCVKLVDRELELEDE
jgi:hypothetical protein